MPSPKTTWNKHGHYAVQFKLVFMGFQVSCGDRVVFLNPNPDPVKDPKMEPPENVSITTLGNLGDY